ncbi:uncharacterized protein LOC122536940 [Frieseomelitta varia]|uniref:uncharacterized protein LOC122536940 n=1 Tax=Frieseomelitta varia TaxID=561572 RepID=UPI001CB6A37E|nr:uncharacterized protein LOC122536940 [Frieseomelitta varia]
MFSMFGWIGYLKRFSLTVLMLSVVVLYYIPESRPYARRICYTLIDLTANGLKSALSGRESEYMYEKIKSNYHRGRHEQSLAAPKCALQEIRGDYENFAQPRRSSTRKPKIFIDADNVGDTKKVAKDHRLSRHRLRSSMINNDPCVDVVKPAYFYSDKTNDAQKYLKTNVSNTKHANSPVENYALLISGSPQQMAMLDQKYEKDDMVIVQDPYMRMEYKECGTSTDKLSSKAEASSSEQEGPTRDHNEEEVETAEDSGSRYSVDKSLYQISEYHCGGECCGSSISSADLSNRANARLNTPVGQRNALKSSRSMVAPTPQRKIEEGNEHLYTIDYSHADDRPMKCVNSSNSRRVDFRAEDINRGHETRTQQKHEENERLYENILKTRRKRFRNESVTNFCGNDVLFTDRGGEADDENSQHEGRACRKHDLDEKPQRENPLFEKNSDGSMFDCYDDIYEEPILKNRFKPALFRAVNWIFGGCPGAARRAALKCGEVGKEESQGLTDEWLL